MNLCNITECVYATLQTFGGCYDSYNLNLAYYPETQQVTHELLQHFYNGYILHRRFIIEVMFVELKPLRLTGKKEIHHSLYFIKNQLEHNIARIYYVVGLCQCAFLAKYIIASWMFH